MKSNTYSNCKLNDQFCKTGESVLYYDRPKELCDLILILKLHKLTLKPTKCSIFCEEVNYLGHVV